MSAFHELRMELTSTEAEQVHLALFCTDEHGQWLLLDDWTADNRDEVQTAAGEALLMVDGWLVYGGAILPA